MAPAVSRRAVSPEPRVPRAPAAPRRAPAAPRPAPAASTAGTGGAHGGHRRRHDRHGRRHGRHRRRHDRHRRRHGGHRRRHDRYGRRHGGHRRISRGQRWHGRREFRSGWHRRSIDRDGRRCWRGWKRRRRCWRRGLRFELRRLAGGSASHAPSEEPALLPLQHLRKERSVGAAGDELVEPRGGHLVLHEQRGQGAGDSRRRLPLSRAEPLRARSRTGTPAV